MASAYTDQEWSALAKEARIEINLPPKEPVQLAFEDPPQPISRYIDHTLLKLDATPEQIRQLCQEARGEKFAVSLEATFTRAPLTV